MRKILLTLALSVCGMAVFAQGGSLPFLTVNGDARTAAMGDAIMGESTGMYIYTNPTSFLLQDSTQNFYGSYTIGMLPKVNDDQILYNAASVGYKRGNQALLVGFRSLNGAEVTKVGSSGTPGKSIKPFDYSVDLTYTRALTSKFSAYLTGTFIQSYVGKSAVTGSASGGVYFRDRIKDVDFTIGAGFYDLGGLVKYGKKEYDQPTSVGLGGSFGYGKRFKLAWTTRYFVLPQESETSKFVGNVGGEFNVIKGLDLRAGYRYQDGGSCATVGGGFSGKMFNVNVAYRIAQEDGVDNSLFLGCSVKF